MTENINVQYLNKIKSRSLLKFSIGVLPRFINHSKSVTKCFIAKLKGAKIGMDSNIPLKLALNANSNLSIGNGSIIESFDIDLREKVIIGNNVIINKGVRIIRQSHNLDSLNFETVGNALTINDYAWVTSETLISPSCIFIGKGAVTASGSVVVKNIEEMEVVGGNPAKYIKKRKTLPYNLLTNSLQGRDLIRYIKAKFF